MTFEELIFPINRTDFLKKYFEKNPLVVKRAQPNYYDRLTTISDVDQILKSGVASGLIEVVMSSAARKILPSEYYDEKVFGNTTVRKSINLSKVYKLFQQDRATIIINQSITESLQLKNFVSEIDTNLKTHSGINIFITPSFAQCFQAHFDEHDLFIIQLFGKKRWKIYENPVYLPLEPQNRQSFDFSGLKLLHDSEIEAGDLVYFPRGFVHEVTTGDSPSLHITLGCMNKTWAQVLMSYVAQYGKQEVLMRGSYGAARLKAETDGVNPIQRFKEHMLNDLTIETLNKLAYQAGINQNAMVPYLENIRRHQTITTN